MLCHGQAISRSTYAALFTAIGTTYGQGNGSTTFNLPDLRGRVVAGKDNMGGSSANRITNAASGITGTTLGASGGVEQHLLTHGQSGVPAHGHNYIDTLRNSVTRANGTVASAGGTEIDSGKTTSANTAANAAEPHINVQPTMILNHIIRVSP
jgi:microcystin-dependent protein